MPWATHSPLSPTWTSGNNCKVRGQVSLRPSHFGEGEGDTVFSLRLRSIINTVLRIINSPTGRWKESWDDPVDEEVRTPSGWEETCSGSQASSRPAWSHGAHLTTPSAPSCLLLDDKPQVLSVTGISA